PCSIGSKKTPAKQVLLFGKKRLKSIFGTDRTAAENRPTGFPAGGAFAPYERFAADKTSAQAGFTSAEYFRSKGEAAPRRRNKKERHDQRSCLSFWSC